ncbi:MAG: aminotransferase class I/II-fold pyridoxal phosphate-dependent enzyme [Thermomicrobiales bacterium]
MVVAQFNKHTVEQLRSVAGVKWTVFPDCIGAFVAEMDFGTAPVIQDALRKIVDDGIFGYCPPSQTDRMRAACASWYRDTTGWDIPEPWIRSIPDVLTAFQATVEHFSPAGAKIIVPTPAYMPFLTLPRFFGRDVVEVPMREVDGLWTYDYEAIEGAYVEHGDGSVLVVCNPCNPIGRVFHADELTPITAIVSRHNGRVFSDEIHAPIVYTGHRHVPYASTSAEAASHTITSVSSSKAWNLAGLKSAQMILSNEADAAHWQDVGYFVEHGASTLGVVGNAVAYAEGRDWLDGVLSYLDRNRHLLSELLAEHLPNARYTMPEGTYLAWIDVSAYQLPDDLATFFREKAKVAVTDGSACGQIGRGFVRFNLAMSSELIEQAIRQMGDAVRAA